MATSDSKQNITPSSASSVKSSSQNDITKERTSQTQAGSKGSVAQDTDIGDNKSVTNNQVPGKNSVAGSQPTSQPAVTDSISPSAGSQANASASSQVQPDISSGDGSAAAVSPSTGGELAAGGLPQTSEISSSGVQVSPSVTKSGAQVSPSVTNSGAQVSPAATKTGVQVSPSATKSGAQVSPSTTKSEGQVTPSATKSGAQVAPSAAKSGAQVSPSSAAPDAPPPGSGTASRPSVAAVAPAASPSAAAAAVAPGLTSRISSLSAAAGVSLRTMIASSSAVQGSLHAMTSGGAIGGDGGGGSESRRVSQARSGSRPLLHGVGSGAVASRPSVVAAGADTGGAEAAEVQGSAAVVGAPAAVKEEPAEPAEASSVTGSAAADGPAHPHESGVFTPAAEPFPPEAERRESAAAEPLSPEAAEAADAFPGASTSSGRRTTLVKLEPAPKGRRSSSYLYNDWDRTLYEKTGRPPPGEAHWSRDSSAQYGRGSTLPGEADERRRSSARPSASPSGRASASPGRRRSSGRWRIPGRPASSPARRVPFDMERCRRDTYDQFGRRIVYHHCFIEPQFTLQGRGIPVSGARKGSISAAADTYAGFAFPLVAPPRESELSAQKVRRRARGGRKRRKRRKRSPRRNVKNERALMEEQWQRLEEESERLEEDKLRLQETRRHLEELEDWWETEGLLILQRDELRAREENMINAVIEEECLRINEEKARLTLEWQLLTERMERQDREEARIKMRTSALEEKQGDVQQQEELEKRKVEELRAVFDIERRMMEVDRKKLVNDVLQGDAFLNAIDDGDQFAITIQPTVSYRQTRPHLTSKTTFSPSEIAGLFADTTDSSLERLLTDQEVPGAPGHERRASARAGEDGDSRGAGNEPPDRPHPRPITARGRPARVSHSSPSGGIQQQRGVPRPSTSRSEGDGRLVTSAASGSGGGGAGETADVWLRQPTSDRREEPSSVLLLSQTEMARPESAGGGWTPPAPPVVLTTSDEPLQRGTSGAALADERVHAKSEGYIDPHAKPAAAAAAERRRASASPQLHFQGASSLVVDKTSGARLSQVSIHVREEVRLDRNSSESESQGPSQVDIARDRGTAEPKDSQPAVDLSAEDDAGSTEVTVPGPAEDSPAAPAPEPNLTDDAAPGSSDAPADAPSESSDTTEGDKADGSSTAAAASPDGSDPRTEASSAAPDAAAAADNTPVAGPPVDSHPPDQPAAPDTVAEASPSASAAAVDPAAVGGDSGVDSPTGSRRSSLRSGDSSHRRVSFQEGAAAQQLADGVDVESPAVGVDVGDDAAERRGSVNPAEGLQEIEGAAQEGLQEIKGAAQEGLQEIEGAAQEGRRASMTPDGEDAAARRSSVKAEETSLPGDSLEAEVGGDRERRRSSAVGGVEGDVTGAAESDVGMEGGGETVMNTSETAEDKLE